MENLNELLVRDYKLHYEEFLNSMADNKECNKTKFGDPMLYYITRTSLKIKDCDIEKISSFFSLIDNYTKSSNLNSKTIRNIQKSFNPIGNIIGIIDETPFKSGKNGLLITTHGIQIKELFKDDDFFDWYDLCFSTLVSGGSISAEYRKIILTEELCRCMQKLIEYIYNNYEDAKDFVWYNIYNIIVRVLDNINDEFNYKDIVRLVNEPYIVQIIEDKDIVLSLMVICMIVNGEFEKAQIIINESDGLQWIENNLSVYRSLYDDENYKKNYNDGQEHETNKEYIDAVKSYQKAFTFHKDIACVQSILNIYYQSASKNNLFNADEYNDWQRQMESSDLILAEDCEFDIYKRRAQELQEKKRQYLDFIFSGMQKAILEKDKQFFSDNPEALTMIDGMGMNAFLYAILYGKTNMLDMFSKAQISELINHKNILGHGYLEVACVGGEYAYRNVLQEFDTDCIKKIKSIHRAKKINKALSVGSSIVSEVLNSASNNATRMDREGKRVLSDDQWDNIARFRERAESLKNKSEELADKSNLLKVYDSIDEYINNRYESTMDELKKSFEKNHIKCTDVLNAEEYLAEIRKISAK